MSALRPKSLLTCLRLQVGPHVLHARPGPFLQEVNLSLVLPCVEQFLTLGLQLSLFYLSRFWHFPGANICTPCVQGTYATGEGTGSNLPNLCEFTLSSDLIGQSLFIAASSKCIPCAAGTYSEAGDLLADFIKPVQSFRPSNMRLACYIWATLLLFRSHRLHFLRTRNLLWSRWVKKHVIVPDYAGTIPNMHKDFFVRITTPEFWILYVDSGNRQPNVQSMPAGKYFWHRWLIFIFHLKFLFFSVPANMIMLSHHASWIYFLYYFHWSRNNV